MSQMMLQKNMSWICNVFYLKWAFVGLSFFSTPDALDCQIVIAFPFFCIFERLCRSNFQIEHIHDFFHQDNSTKISIFGIYSIWNGCCWWNILYLKILPALVKFWEPKNKILFFSMGFGSFFKSPQNLKLQQRPPEDLKVLLLGSSRHQLLFEMAPGDPPICNFYLKKWWIFSILVVWNIYLYSICSGGMCLWMCAT